MAGRGARAYGEVRVDEGSTYVVLTERRVKVRGGVFGDIPAGDVVEDGHVDGKGKVRRKAEEIR